MTSIAQINENEQREIRGSLKKYFAEYHLSGLLKMCRAEKQKGFSAFEIFRYLLCLVFCDRSMYMQIVTGRYEERFSKNAVYRFLSSARTNWERLICTLSERIINSSIRKLTSEDRQDAFIIDDTMFTRTGGKKRPGCRPDIYGWTQPASVCVIKALGEVLFLLQRKRKVCRIQRESL